MNQSIDNQLLELFTTTKNKEGITFFSTEKQTIMDKILKYCGDNDLELFCNKFGIDTEQFKLMSKDVNKFSYSELWSIHHKIFNNKSMLNGILLENNRELFETTHDIRFELSKEFIALRLTSGFHLDEIARLIEEDVDKLLSIEYGESYYLKNNVDKVDIDIQEYLNIFNKYSILK